MSLCNQGTGTKRLKTKPSKEESKMGGRNPSVLLHPVGLRKDDGRLFVLGTIYKWF